MREGAAKKILWHVRYGSMFCNLLFMNVYL
jgi:hypothetical protein